MAAIPGCSFHRTGHGFIVDSHWSLEYHRTPWLMFRTGEDALCDADCPNCDSHRNSDLAQQPELVPWRSRGPGQRLAARLFHGRDALAEQSSDDNASESVTPPPDPVAANPEAPEEVERPTASKKPAEAPSSERVMPLAKACSYDLFAD